MMWCRFADPVSLAALLEDLCSEKACLEDSALLTRLLESLEYNATRLTTSFFAYRLPLLAAAQAHSPNSAVLENLIDIALQGIVPPFCDNMPSDATMPNGTVADILTNTSLNPEKTAPKHQLDVSAFLEKSDWTDKTASIVAKLVYVDPQTRTSVRSWHSCLNTM